MQRLQGTLVARYEAKCPVAFFLPLAQINYRFSASSVSRPVPIDSGVADVYIAFNPPELGEYAKNGHLEKCRKSGPENEPAKFRPARGDDNLFLFIRSRRSNARVGRRRSASCPDTDQCRGVRSDGLCAITYRRQRLFLEVAFRVAPIKLR